MNEKRPNLQSVHEELREYNLRHNTSIFYDEETRTFFTNRERKEMVKFPDFPRGRFYESLPYEHIRIPEKYLELLVLMELQISNIVKDEMIFEGKSEVRHGKIDISGYKEGAHGMVNREFDDKIREHARRYNIPIEHHIALRDSFY